MAGMEKIFAIIGSESVQVNGWPKHRQNDVCGGACRVKESLTQAALGRADARHRAIAHGSSEKDLSPPGENNKTQLKFKWKLATEKQNQTNFNKGMKLGKNRFHQAGEP